MWRIVVRLILPALLLVGGIASLIYGAKYHTAPVVEEKEIEVSLAPPMGDGFLPGFEGPPGFPPPLEGPPGLMSPMIELPPELMKQKQIISITKEEPESILIREITVGGVALLDSGELKRTYSGEAPPSLCPT